MRKNSFAIEGGSFGDEGKGKIVDLLSDKLAQSHKNIVVYRWNGGANAGHTVVAEGTKIVLHNIPSGSLTKGAIAILGKGMVIHPMDLVKEMIELAEKFGLPNKLIVDEMAVLSLDTHRAFEGALKNWAKGGKGSTGRGIAPSYADVLLRHPLRMRDLTDNNWQEKLKNHYLLYEALVAGLGEKLAEAKVITISGEVKKVGDLSTFLSQIEFVRPLLLPFIKNSTFLVKKHWEGKTPFIFEGAQGVGLDPKWGVYPDVTSSEVSFSGIHYSTEGLVDPKEIEYKIAVYKATYMSSVGTRNLPTKMKKSLVHKIREDAHEYGSTTGRPRDIYHVDLAALKYFKEVSGATHMVLTHLDIAYPNEPIKLCTRYLNGENKIARYRPYQESIDKVSPSYVSLPSWNGKKVQGVKKQNELPKKAKDYIAKLAKEIGLIPFMVSTGPNREDLIDYTKS